MNYTKELTLHIQGLSIYFHQAFEEVDKYIDVDIPSGTQVHSAYIRKIGGYKPNLVRILYKSKEGNELQQAYMAKYVEGNLVCSPVQEVSISHPFSHECTLNRHPIGIALHVSSKYINQESNLLPNEPNNWVGIYQEGIIRLINPYVLDIHSGITYLHT